MSPFYCTFRLLSRAYILLIWYVFSRHLKIMKGIDRGITIIIYLQTAIINVNISLNDHLNLLHIVFF